MGETLNLREKPYKDQNQINTEETVKINERAMKIY